jgi:hypothetical protein
MLKRIFVSALLIISGTLFVFVRELDDEWRVTKRDRTMSFTTFVLFDMFSALSCRHETKSIFAIGVFSNRAFCVAVGISLIGQLLVIYLPFLQETFQTEAVSLVDLFYMIMIASSVFIVDEGRKRLFSSSDDHQRRHHRGSSRGHRRHAPSTQCLMDRLLSRLQHMWGRYVHRKIHKRRKHSYNRADSRDWDEKKNEDEDLDQDDTFYDEEEEEEEDDADTGCAGPQTV